MQKKKKNDNSKNIQFFVKLEKYHKSLIQHAFEMIKKTSEPICEVEIQERIPFDIHAEEAKYVEQIEDEIEDQEIIEQVIINEELPIKKLLPQ